MAHVHFERSVVYYEGPLEFLTSPCSVSTKVSNRDIKYV